MSLTLFAKQEGDSDPASLFAAVALGVVLLLVLRWLYKIGFYRKIVVAAIKSTFGLTAVAGGIFGVAAFLGEAGALLDLIDANAGTMAFAGAGVLGAGLFVFYERPPAASKPNGAASGTAAIAAPRIVLAGGGTLCPDCRGSGKVEHTCGACYGSGEFRCSHSVQATYWYGETYTKEWCKAGELYTHYAGNTRLEGRCPHCCGRGFVKCTLCASRGSCSSTCDRCQGNGVL